MAATTWTRIEYKHIHVNKNKCAYLLLYLNVLKHAYTYATLVYVN